MPRTFALKADPDAKPSPQRQRVRMKVLTETEVKEGSVRKNYGEPGEPQMKELKPGGHDMLCGNCGALLAENHAADCVLCVILACDCGTFNGDPRWPPPYRAHTPPLKLAPFPPESLV